MAKKFRRRFRLT